jgi:hypothetical protein
MRTQSVTLAAGTITRANGEPGGLPLLYWLPPLGATRRGL